MKRWFPALFAFAFTAGIIFLANAGYAVRFFAAAQRSGGDKLGHFCLLGGLAFCVNWSLGGRTWRGWLVGSLIVGVLCTLEEFSQIWIDNRHCDPLDLAANLAGIWVAGLLVRRVCARRSQV